MANNPQDFEMFVTSVESMGPLLKVWGQTDQASMVFIERFLHQFTEDFDMGRYVPNIANLKVGQHCIGKYKDDGYYRARIEDLSRVREGLINVHFFDHGNREALPLTSIRVIEGSSPITSFLPLAHEFIIAGVVNVAQFWDPHTIDLLTNMICNLDLKGTMVTTVGQYKLIHLEFNQVQLSQQLIDMQLAFPCAINTQLAILTQKIASTVVIPSNIPQPNINRIPYQQVTVPQNEIKQFAPSATATVPDTPATYKNTILSIHTEHLVNVSAVEDGPKSFALQLQNWDKYLNKIMTELNTMPTTPVREVLAPGTPCIARCKVNRVLCRAVFIQPVDENCKVYFVDFGHNDVIPCSDIFELPLRLIGHKILALRFSLANLKSITITPELKQAFKEYVIGKTFRLKVTTPEGPPLMQYGELYDERHQNVLSILKTTLGLELIKYRPVAQLETDCIVDILVSYVKNCQEFYVHFLSDIDQLHRLMVDVANHCEASAALPATRIQPGMACCALFVDDDQWYRVQVLQRSGQGYLVKYVDYGNEGVVSLKHIRDIPIELANRLPVQAVRCCLLGYEETSAQDHVNSAFEDLVLEKKFTMKILRYHSPGVVLVDLVESSSVPVTTALKIQSPPAISPPAVMNNAQLGGSDAERIEQRKNSWRNPDPPPRVNENESAHSTRNSNNSPSPSQRPPLRAKQNYDREDNRQHSRPRNSSFPNERDENRKTTRPRNDPITKIRNNGPDTRRSESAASDAALNDSWNSDKSEPKSNWRTEPKRATPKKDFKHRRNGSNSDGYGSDRSKSSEKSDRSFRRKATIGTREAPPDYAALDTKYTELVLEDGTIEDVNISWFYNPKKFYVRVTSSESDFKKVMSEIQKTYRKRKPLQENIPAGSSVIAHFKEDGYLYRGTILDVRQNKYKVCYVDYGNTNYVDKHKIWRIEKKFMVLPVQSVVCCLSGVFPSGESWSDSPEMDQCFSKGQYQCVFQGYEENKRIVNLSSNGLLVVDELITKGLAVPEVAEIEVSQDQQDNFNLSQQIPGIEHDIEEAPVDLSLLSEQTLRIHVACIYGLERFYIYLNKTQAADVLKNVNDFMKASETCNLQPALAEELVIGNACITKTETGIWQRCIISNPASTNGIFVEFPDVGGGDEVSAEKLYLLPPELSNYYYQALECSVHNFTLGCAQLMTDEAFQSTYEGTDLIIYIDNVTNGRLVVTPYDLDGNLLALLVANGNAYSSIDPICPLPVFSSNSKVWVSTVNSADSLYIQPMSESNNSAILLQNLYDHYNSIDAVCEPAVDHLYAVKSGDGNWYRAKVVNINDPNVTVRYIDYGNEETLPKTSLRELDPSFYIPYELALHVALPIVAKNDITEQIIQLTTDKIFYAKLAFTEGCWYAELYDEHVGLSQNLTSRGISEPLDFDPFRRREVVTETEVFSNDSKILLFISHADSPGQFFAQLTNDETSINALQTELELALPTLSALELPDAGVLCAAQYSADGIWYRAEVLDADDQITTVRFIDFGNTDVLDNSSGVIKTLPADMLTIDRYAKKCSLDLIPVGDEWNQVACELFEEKVVNQTCQADILYQDDRGTMYVNLEINNENIASLILDGGHGQSIVRDLDEEISSKTGFISHVNSLNEFWIQLESSCADLELVSDHLAIADKFPDLIEKGPGVLCAAKYPDDDDWYRARILTIADDSIQVLFIDYGNSSPASDLKMLPEQVINMRALAMKCSLLKPQGLLEWPQEATPEFQTLAADGATVFDVKVITTGETSIVELSINGSNIINQLVPDDLSIERLPPIGENPLQNSVVSHFESPISFWIQLESQKSEIDKMSQLLLNADDFPKVTNPDVNDIYVAQLVENKIWYRVAIISTEGDNGYKVLFIDTGNTSITNDLRIPVDVLTSAPLAKHCSLELPEGMTTWSDSAIEELSKLCTDVQTVFQVEFLNDEKPATVRLYVNEINILGKITSYEYDVEMQEKIPSPVSLSKNVCSAKELDGVTMNGEVTSYDKCKNIIDALSQQMGSTSLDQTIKNELIDLNIARTDSSELDAMSDKLTEDQNEPVCDALPVRDKPDMNVYDSAESISHENMSDLNDIEEPSVNDFEEKSSQTSESTSVNDIGEKSSRKSESTSGNDIEEESSQKSDSTSEEDSSANSTLVGKAANSTLVGKDDEKDISNDNEPLENDIDNVLMIETLTTDEENQSESNSASNINETELDIPNICTMEQEENSGNSVPRSSTPDSDKVEPESVSTNDLDEPAQAISEPENLNITTAASPSHTPISISPKLEHNIVPEIISGDKSGDSLQPTLKIAVGDEIAPDTVSHEESSKGEERTEI